MALQEQSPLTTALVTVPLIPGAVPIDGKGWSLLVQRLARLQAQRSAALTCGDLPTYLRLNGRIHRIQRRLLSQIRDSPLAPRRRQRVGKLKRLMLRLQQWFKPNALHPRSPQNRLSYPSSGRSF
ncbi:hypothetical protein H6F94_25385 [Leptolyngbya sp. FACHB-261]|nr:hypothetical protein [Leptolyngbya sp. FACHB-261]